MDGEIVANIIVFTATSIIGVMCAWDTRELWWPRKRDDSDDTP